MAIDVLTETLLSFRQLAESIRNPRGDRPVHVSTIHRWHKRGVRGVRLEATRIGVSWHTSKEAFSRFCDRLSESSGIENPGARESRANSHVRSTNELLDKSGW